MQILDNVYAALKIIHLIILHSYFPLNNKLMIFMIFYLILKSKFTLFHWTKLVHMDFISIENSFFFYKFYDSRKIKKKKFIYILYTCREKLYNDKR